jgi:hypothetical protein
MTTPERRSSDPTSDAPPAAARAELAMPQRRWLTSRAEVAAQLDILLALSAGEVCVADHDLALFALSTRSVVERFERLLVGQRSARILLLVDDVTWLERDAPRLRAMQRQFPHALRMRQAAGDDTVGEERVAIFDERHVIDAQPTRHGIADAWQHHPLRAQAARRVFERRWQAAAHDLPVVPLALAQRASIKRARCCSAPDIILSMGRKRATSRCSSASGR